jgi:hypothetical protein
MKMTVAIIRNTMQDEVNKFTLENKNQNVSMDLKQDFMSSGPLESKKDCLSLVFVSKKAEITKNFAMVDILFDGDYIQVKIVNRFGIGEKVKKQEIDFSYFEKYNLLIGKTKDVNKVIRLITNMDLQETALRIS